MAKMAILIDGGFYRARARNLFSFSRRDPGGNADIVEAYCRRHAEESEKEGRELYRIFYYDCPPISAVVTNPITNARIDLSKSPTFTAITQFLRLVAGKRKVALRRGRLGSGYVRYALKPKTQDALLSGRKTLAELAENDVRLDIGQKGVDMRLGLDLVEIALKRLVDQVVLVSGDSDFIPAIKMARREGVDVILDPMGNHVPEDLAEHVDGIRDFSSARDFLDSLPPVAPAS